MQGFSKIKNAFVNFYDIIDEHISDFEFQSNYKYSIINFSNNKIYKLKSFEKNTTTQLINILNNKLLLFSFYYLKSLNNIEIIALKKIHYFVFLFIILLFVLFNFIDKILSLYIIFNYNFTIFFSYFAFI